MPTSETSVRTPVNADGQTLSYVVTPDPGRQLQQVDLQVLTIVVDEQGRPQYTPLRLWVLRVTPAG